MKLYLDPIATTCRPLTLFLADHHMQLETEVVNLMAGEHLAEAFAQLNPNRAVPVLVDAAGVLTESSAILKHLADMVGSPTYPTDPRARAEVNAAMDWFNTGFYRDFGYGYVYPQVLPQYALPEGPPQAALLAKGRERTGRWLEILDRRMLGARDFVAGRQPTLADYLGAGFVSLGDWIGFDLAPWPAVQAWIARMRERPACRATWAEYDRFTASLAEARAAA